MYPTCYDRFEDEMFDDDEYPKTIGAAHVFFPKPKGNDDDESDNQDQA